MREFRFLDEKRKTNGLTPVEHERWQQLGTSLGVELTESEAPPQGYYGQDGQWYQYPPGFDPSAWAAQQVGPWPGYYPPQGYYDPNTGAWYPYPAYYDPNTGAYYPAQSGYGYPPSTWPQQQQPAYGEAPTWPQEAYPQQGDWTPQQPPTEQWTDPNQAYLDQPPIEQTPTEQAPTEQAPTEQAPTEPTPIEPAPTEPTPTEPTPIEPTPIEQGWPSEAAAQPRLVPEPFSLGGEEPASAGSETGSVNEGAALEAVEPLLLRSESRPSGLRTTPHFGVVQPDGASDLGPRPGSSAEAETGGPPPTLRVPSVSSFRSTASGLRRTSVPEAPPEAHTTELGELDFAEAPFLPKPDEIEPPESSEPQPLPEEDTTFLRNAVPANDTRRATPGTEAEPPFSLTGSTPEIALSEVMDFGAGGPPYASLDSASEVSSYEIVELPGRAPAVEAAPSTDEVMEIQDEEVVEILPSASAPATSTGALAAAPLPAALDSLEDLRSALVLGDDVRPTQPSPKFKPVSPEPLAPPQPVSTSRSFLADLSPDSTAPMEVLPELLLEVPPDTSPEKHTEELIPDADDIEPFTLVYKRTPSSAPLAAQTEPALHPAAVIQAIRTLTPPPAPPPAAQPFPEAPRPLTPPPAAAPEPVSEFRSITPPPGPAKTPSELRPLPPPPAPAAASQTLMPGPAWYEALPEVRPLTAAPAGAAPRPNALADTQTAPEEAPRDYASHPSAFDELALPPDAAPIPTFAESVPPEANEGASPLTELSHKDADEWAHLPLVEAEHGDGLGGSPSEKVELAGPAEFVTWSRGPAAPDTQDFQVDTDLTDFVLESGPAATLATGVSATATSGFDTSPLPLASNAEFLLSTASAETSELWAPEQPPPHPAEESLIEGQLIPEVEGELVEEGEIEEEGELDVDLDFAGPPFSPPPPPPPSRPTPAPPEPAPPPVVGRTASSKSYPRIPPLEGTKPANAPAPTFSPPGALSAAAAAAKLGVSPVPLNPPAPPPAPPPPRTETTPVLIEGEHRVILHTMEGGVKRGAIRDANLASAQVVLQTSPGVNETVPRERVKAIFFMLSPGTQAPAPEGIKVRVTFRDGRQVAGYSKDHRSGASGFFVVPADHRTNTERIFIYRHSVTSVSVESS